MIDVFEKLLAAGKDNALLRFSLGNEYAKLSQWARAQAHLRAALAHDPSYTAAWKLLGKCAAAAGEASSAIQAYERGIEVAKAHGDKQAMKEMAVFLKRLHASASSTPHSNELGTHQEP